MNSNYAVVKHWQENHRELEEPPDYKYQLISSHRTATERQIWESLYIENEKCDILLNGKGEWGLNVLPRLKTEDDQLTNTGSNTEGPSEKRKSNFDEVDNKPAARPNENDSDFSNQFAQR